MSSEQTRASASAPTVQRIAIVWRGRTVELEYQWLGERSNRGAPLLVFLHEGLGSLAMWKDFPAQLCAAGGFRGLVYSRPAYGRSTPRAVDDFWAVDFMHRQAHEVLPALLQALNVQEAPWLFGHSDGASIALLYAAHRPAQVQGLVLMAPHIFVEDVTVANIEIARDAFENTDLPARLGRYHDDVGSAFYGWNRIWLDHAFRRWNIEAELDAITVPVLAMQGSEDEYGTMAQVQGIAQRVAGTQLLELSHCGHSPHRDAPAEVIAQTIAFVRTHTAA